MNEKINKVELQKFSFHAKIFAVLMIVLVASFVPLVKFLGYYGVGVWIIIALTTFCYSLKIEKIKKNNNIQTHKEIIAFSEGRQLDETEAQIEYGKRNNQKAIMALGSALITGVVILLINWLINIFM